MHNSLRALMAGTVRVEGEELPVAGAWLDMDARDLGARALRYVGLDVGGWLDRHVALVPADRLSWEEPPPGEGAPGWRAAVAREEIEAPEARLDGAGEGGPLDLSALPPVITGPFGYTISPLMMGAGLMAEAEDERPPAPPGAGGDAGDDVGEGTPREEARALARAEDWIGAGLDLRGPLATDLVIEDLLIEARAAEARGPRVTHIVVDAGGAARAVPVAHVGRRGAADAAVPVDLLPAEIEAAPEIVAPR